MNDFYKARQDNVAYLKIVAFQDALALHDIIEEVLGDEILLTIV